MLVNDVKRQYAPRILALLERIRQVCEPHGIHWSEPEETTDDCYRWQMFEPQAKVDLTFEISEQVAYEGKGGGDGINFSLTVVADGGRILGGLTPFNYTPQLWVPLEPAAVEERFKILEDADPGDIVTLMMEAT